MIEVVSSLSCLISGVDPINPSQKCLGINNGKIGPVDSTGGAIGVMGNLIAMTFTPPAGASDYVNYLAGNFGISKKAYAADQNGTGFSGIFPLLPLWVAFRNMTYLIFVIVFVVIGFAIMLRVHIDPRTVMTIENQIPKIIIGLILVTFSFAIAGFLIDLMWVLTYLVIGFFTTIPGIHVEEIQAASQHLQGENAIGAFNNFVHYNDVVSNSAGAVSGVIQHLLCSAQSGCFSSGNILDILKDILGWLIGSIAAILAFIVIAIAVLFALFRLWFTLIQAYIFIILDVVLSPFWVIGGLLPGANIGFTAWLRDITSNLLAFPATIVMFLLANAFMNYAGRDGQIFAPPLVGNANVPGAIQSLIALGIILLTPNIVTMLKAALKAPKFDMGAIGQAVGVGAAVPSNIARGVGGTYMAGHEYVLAEGGQPKQRSIGTALWGRILGRGG